MYEPEVLAENHSKKTSTQKSMMFDGRKRIEPFKFEVTLMLGKPNIPCMSSKGEG